MHRDTNFSQKKTLFLGISRDEANGRKELFYVQRQKHDANKPKPHFRKWCRTATARRKLVICLLKTLYSYYCDALCVRSFHIFIFRCCFFLFTSSIASTHNNVIIWLNWISATKRKRYIFNFPQHSNLNKQHFEELMHDPKHMHAPDMKNQRNIGFLNKKITQNAISFAYVSFIFVFQDFLFQFCNKKKWFEKHLSSCNVSITLFSIFISIALHFESSRDTNCNAMYNINRVLCYWNWFLAFHHWQFFHFLFSSEFLPLSYLSLSYNVLSSPVLFDTFMCILFHFPWISHFITFGSFGWTYNIHMPCDKSIKSWAKGNEIIYAKRESGIMYTGANMQCMYGKKRKRLFLSQLFLSSI